MVIIHRLKEGFEFSSLSNKREKKRKEKKKRGRRCFFFGCDKGIVATYPVEWNLLKCHTRSEP